MSAKKVVVDYTPPAHSKEPKQGEVTRGPIPDPSAPGRPVTAKDFPIYPTDFDDNS